MKSSWFGPFFVLSLGIGFLVLLGSSWGRFWSSGAPLGLVFGRSGGRFGAFSTFQLIDSPRQLINSSIQLINSSTDQPMGLRHFLTRPGGLRAARLNKSYEKKCHEVALPQTTITQSCPASCCRSDAAVDMKLFLLSITECQK